MNTAARSRVYAPPDSPVLAGIGHVDPTWLARRLGAPTLRVLDVRTDSRASDESGTRLRRPSRRGPPSVYLDGHVPGAVTLDVRASLFDARGDVISAPELAMVMSGLGVGDQHTIVLVDEGSRDGALALAAAWALGRYGHSDVHVLEGGFARWVGEGRAVSPELTRHAPASYTAKVPNGGGVSDLRGPRLRTAT